VRRGTVGRELLRDYARQTRAGNRGTVAAWQRLQRALDGAATHGAPRAAVASLGRTGARRFSVALAAALALWIASGVLPSRLARQGGLRATVGHGGAGLGGATGSGEPGGGGAEGSSGSHAVRGETAAAGTPLLDPLRAG
jgi:hypothetical protein